MELPWDRYSQEIQRALRSGWDGTRAEGSTDCKWRGRVGAILLVVGGADDRGFFLSSAELYDPTTGTWTLAGRMAQSRASILRPYCPTGRCWSPAA